MRDRRDLSAICLLTFDNTYTDISVWFLRIRDLLCECYGEHLRSDDIAARAVRVNSRIQ